MFKNPIEPEFCYQETASIIIDIVERYIKGHPNENRRVDLLSSFLIANKDIHSAGRVRENIKTMFRGVSEMNTSLKNKLTKLGCTVETGRKHHKIRLNGDTRYQVTMSKTGSDRRAGDNLASSMNRIMF